MIFVGAFGTKTRLGEIAFAGQRIGEPPRVPAPYRTMPDWVVTYVIDGEGAYRHADGTAEAITAGTVILVPPGVRHWYGTRDGEPWSEIFVVCNGPVFDLVLGSGGGTRLGDGPETVRSGPRRPSPAPSIHRLEAIVRAAESTHADAEHRLLALADWLVDVVSEPAPNRPSAEIEVAARRLLADTSAELDMHDVAVSVGLSYTTFRRRFVAEWG